MGPPDRDAGTAPVELRIDVEQPLLCAGRSAAGRVRISGGAPPYQLRIVENGAGLHLEPAPDGAADVSVLDVLGTAAAGQLRLEIEDSGGEIVQAEPIVARDPPRVSSLALPVGCAALGYATELLAEGGEGTYSWRAELLAEPAQGPGSLGDLGLRVSGSLLAGELSESSGSFALAVSVRDALCESEPVQLALDIVPAESSECPAISLRAPAQELPPACLGNVYAEALSAEGSEPPYSWAALEVPPGLQFDVSSGLLSGVAERAGQLRVQLRDALGRTVEQAYSLAVRDKCWLGYIASERQPARLELVDMRLLARQPEQARRSLPLAPSSAAALDFRFAPGGRWLAYRHAQLAERRLELLRVADARALELDGVTAADAYAFARDASALAVSFRRGEQTFLGGFELSGAQPMPAAPGAELSGVRELEQRAVPPVASPLVWYEQRQLAFLTPDERSPSRRRLVTTLLTGTTFVPPVVHAEQEFSEQATLLESASGVFVADPEAALIAFFPPGGAAASILPAGTFVSPSGALVARVEAGALELTRAPEAGSAFALSAGGCSSLLAWSPERELIACAGEGGAPRMLTLWQAQPEASQLLPLGPRRDADVIASPSFTGLRRVFSGSGAWLAVGADDALYVARPEPAARLSFRLPGAALGLPASVLAFSPDERALLAGAANTLGWLELSRGAGSFQVLSASALLDEGCSEDLLAGYGAWCGSSSASPNVSWSAGSELIAFRSVLGTLQVVDVSRAGEGIVGQPLSPDVSCSEACSSASTARFQP